MFVHDADLAVILTSVLLLPLLVVLEAACVVLVDLQRDAAVVAIRIVVAVVEQLRLLRGAGGRFFGEFTLHAVGRLLALRSRHCVRGVCHEYAQRCVLQICSELEPRHSRGKQRPTKKRKRQEFDLRRPEKPPPGMGLTSGGRHA